LEEIKPIPTNEMGQTKQPDGESGSSLPRVEQAGAIAVRSESEGLQFLIVRARRKPNEWVFPKGHLEPGEGPQDAALRELREEAGVEGSIRDFAGSLDFTSGTEQVTVQYYLVDYRETVRAQEQREIRWCSYAEAHRLLSFPDAQQLLGKAYELARTKN
jgi:8-oxo-dGTP pyrophosphatase MutT (NUDIX family)